MNPSATKIKRWREDPLAFVAEVFQATPDAWQEEALKYFSDPKKQRLAMKACKGPGKSCVLAWISWNFLLTRPHPKIGAISITEDNLKDCLWAEMAFWQRKSKLLQELFTWNKERIYCKSYPETWFMAARTWSKDADSTKQSESLAGLHAEYVMFVMDEAGGIPDAVASTAEGVLATGKESRIVIAGNPTRLEGPLYRACTSQRDLWTVIKITGDPDDPARSPRINREWALQQIATHGRDNPWVKVNVFGEFPPASLNSLVGPDEVEAAMHRIVKTEDYMYSQKRLGIDAARFGDDSWIIFPRQGLLASPCVEMKNPRSQEVAARVAQAKAHWGSEVEFFDGTGGFASGAIDSAIQAGMTPQEIQFSGKADDPRYANKRAEMWFRMAEWIKRGGALPPDAALAKELTTPTYMFNQGRFQLEEKDQIRKRLGFSPDRADALALTFAIAEQPSSVDPVTGQPTRGSGGHLSDFDPYNEKHKDY